MFTIGANSAREEAEALQVAALLSQEVRNLLQQGYAKDTEFKEAWKSSDTSSLFVKQDGLLFLRTSNKLTHLCIPNNNRLRTKVISDYHDSQIAAHLGNRRTFLRVAQWYYWKSLLRRTAMVVIKNFQDRDVSLLSRSLMITPESPWCRTTALKNTFAVVHASRTSCAWKTCRQHLIWHRIRWKPEAL